MANDAVLRFSLVCLVAIIFMVGLATHSFKKMLITYIVGIFGIAGVLLPDWCFFDRDFNRWTSPVTDDERAADRLSATSGFRRFRIYPIRLVGYTAVYSYVLYKWWQFMSNST